MAGQRRNGAAPFRIEDSPMIDLKAIDDLARRLSDMVPPNVKAAQADLENNFRAALQTGLGKLDLVTREEFEVQRAVLLRTREKLEALERTVAELEARLAAACQTPPQPH
jgi:BMFP domain-containing protein YqiC